MKTERLALSTWMPGGAGAWIPVFASLLAVTALPVAGEEASSRSAVEEQAEVSPSGYVPPPEEWRLGERGQRKSQALAHYFLGLSKENAGDVEGALESYETVLDLSPHEIELSKRAAVLSAKYGDPAKALRIMEKSFAQNRDNPDAYLYFSQYLSTFHQNNRENVERSLSVMEEAIDRFPDNPELYERLVTLHLVRNDRGEATRTLTRGLGRPNTNPAYWLEMARIAQKVWPLSKGNGVDTINGIYEKALRFGKGRPKVETTVADYYSLTHQFERARELYEGIIADRPEDLAAREKLARVYSLLGQEDKVLETLVELEQINPHRIETQKFLARIYQEREDYGKAVEHFQKAFRIAKGSAGEYRAVSVMMIMEDQPNEAVAILERALFHYPDNEDLMISLARAYNAAERFEEAYRAFKRTEDHLAQSNPGGLDDLFYFSYGAAAERSSKIDVAANLFRKAIELVPKDQPERAAMPYNYLGYMWLEQDKNIDEAGQLIIMANDLNPDSGAYVDSLGWYYFKKGEYQKALKTLKRAAELLKMEDEEDAVIYDHIGQTYFKLGHKDKALEYVERAAKMDPANDEISKRLKEFREMEAPEPQELELPESGEEKPAAPGASAPRPAAAA